MIRFWISMEEKLHSDLTENLPREIVHLILSFLPMKEAVRTCLLSTAWSCLWKPLVLNNLETNDIVSSSSSDDHDQPISKSDRHRLISTETILKQHIAAFLDNHDHDAPRKLKFSIGGHSNIRGAVVATKGYVDDELHIGFYKNDDKAISTSTTACEGNDNEYCSLQFKLEGRLSSCGQKFPAEIAAASTFLSLKTLHLRSITAGLAENFVSSLLSSCCSLESLKLEKCGGLRRIDIGISTAGGSSTSLQMLEFRDCSNVDTMVISAPNLKTLYYAGVLPTKIQLQGTPHLVDVKFDVGYGGLGQNEFDCEQLIIFLSSLKETQFLTISGWIIEWMCCGGVIFGRLDFKLSKLKKLWCIYSDMMDARKRDSLACFLNIAPLLEMLFINMDKNWRSMELAPPFFHEYWHEPHLWKDYATVKSESSHLVHLKVIEIVGFSSSTSKSIHELLLIIDHLLHKALNLKPMIVTSPFEANGTHDSWRVSN